MLHALAPTDRECACVAAPSFLPAESRPMPRAASNRVWERVNDDQIIDKETLAKEVAAILKERKLTQIEAAYLAGDAPSQMSLVVSGKLRGFSIERLLRILARLGRDIDIVISRAPENRMGRIKVQKKGR
jgi:predicted XRE-type DNA-binding protein